LDSTAYRSETITHKLFKITETGPRIFSKKTAIEKKYSGEPVKEFYLVYRIEEVKENVVINRECDISKLEKYKSGEGSVLPFAITLTELMEVVRNGT
jgi:hypothetical protein